jgi:hypothetical protein
MKVANWILVHKNNAPAVEGETITDFRGEKAILTGGRPPHKPSSSGFVFTDNGGMYYPSVFKLEWIKE